MKAHRLIVPSASSGPTTEPVAAASVGASVVEGSAGAPPLFASPPLLGVHPARNDVAIVMHTKPDNHFLLFIISLLCYFVYVTSICAVFTDIGPYIRSNQVRL